MISYVSIPRWVAACDASTQARLTYWNLAVLAAEQGSGFQCETSDEELGKRLGRAASTARRLIQEAEAANLVSELAQRRCRTRNGQPVQEPTFRVVLLAGDHPLTTAEVREARQAQWDELRGVRMDHRLLPGEPQT